MRDAENIHKVAQTGPDIMGFIFYPDSRRHLPPERAGKVMEMVPEGIEKAGVFVNSTLNAVLKIGNALELDYLQLHGDESPEMCIELKKSGFRVVKVFGVDEFFDFTTLNSYRGAADYFLFDTKSPEHGGTGRVFKWEILNNYDGEIPFFLSGGIGLEHLDLLDEVKAKNLYALDVNSRFELSPGVKDLQRVKELIGKLKKLNNG